MEKVSCPQDRKGKGTRSSECIKASEKVFYEYRMLEQIFCLHRSGQVGTIIHNNSLIESFLSHSRVLIEFLFLNKDKTDDNSSDNISAIDFIHEDSFESNTDFNTGKYPLYLCNIKQRTNKRLAHLTYSRLDVKLEDKAWDMRMIYMSIMREIYNWLIFVDKKKLHEKWNDLHDEAVKYRKDSTDLDYTKGKTSREE